jgi:hypothetical protein
MKIFHNFIIFIFGRRSQTREYQRGFAERSKKGPGFVAGTAKPITGLPKIVESAVKTKNTICEVNDSGATKSVFLQVRKPKEPKRPDHLLGIAVIFESGA